MTGKARLIALLLPALLLTPGPGIAPARDWQGRAVDLSAEYERASEDFDALLAMPDSRTRPDLWNEAERKFRAIVSTDPGGSRADEAAFMVGEVNYQRYRLFPEQKYLDAAVAAYKRVLETYRFSSRRVDALVRLADIQYHNLDDSRQAYLLYRRAARDYPGTDGARTARVRVVAMEARWPDLASADDAAIDAVAAPPQPGRPLPSPGAILGGKADAGRPAGGGAAADVAEGGPDLPGSPVAGGLPVPAVPKAESPEREAPAGDRMRRGTAAVRRTPADPGRSKRDGRHPLLEEGPIPLKRPSDNLPALRSLQPRL